MSLRSASLLALLCLGPLACSSSSFEVAASSPTDDDAGEVGPSDDAGSDTSAPSDTGGVVDAGPCAPLSGNPTTIFVDGRTKRASIGSAECPTRTIREALAIVGTLPTGDHTIRIAGGAPSAPVVYDEAGLVLVKTRTKLEGDGAARVVITGGGPCGGASTASCVVALEGNAAIEGVTIDAKGPKVGLAVTPAAFTASGLKDVTVTGSKGDTNPAVYVNGAGNVDLVDVRVTDNQGPGVHAASVFRLKVSSTLGGPRSTFDRNLVGIHVDGGILELGGADARDNVTHGIAITSASAGTHALDDLNATGNGANGVLVEGGANLKLRRSKLVSNRVGLLFRFGLLNDLDLGTASDPGKNHFGGVSANNKYAGICLPVARATHASAHDNLWAACGPTSLPLSEGDTCNGLSGFQDVRYRPTGVGGAPKPPLDFGDCTAGP